MCFMLGLNLRFEVSIQVPISPTFYEQLLHEQSQKVQKDSQLMQLFALLGSACMKTACKHVDEIDPWFQLHQHFTSRFFCSKVFCTAFSFYNLCL